jgi:Skp family chaperone for outer membrane proteins
MERDYKSKVEEAELEMKMAMQKITEQLAKEVEKAVVELAKKDKLDAVVDTTTGRVIYTADNVNLTPDLVVSMDKSFDAVLAQNKTAKKPAAKTA